MKHRIPIRKPSWFVVGLFAVLFVHVQAEAFVLSGYRWPGSHPRVPFYVSTNWAGHVYMGQVDTNGFPAPTGTLEDAVRAITNAAHTWNTQGDSNLKFYFAGITDITNVVDKDGINVILYDPTPCSLTPGCNGRTTFDNAPDIFFEGFDVVLNGFRSDGLPTLWSASILPRIWERDIESTVLHELGHAAGLNHSDITQTVMGRVPGNGSRQRTLAVDDANGIQAIYGPYANDGLWASNPTPGPGETVTLFLDYPEAARQQYQVVADFDGLNAGYDLRNEWLADSRIFPLDRCPHPIGSLSRTPLEELVLPANTGTLDASGRAQVTVRIPETFSCFPTNRRWFFSAVTYGTNPPSYIEDAGMAVALDIQPPPGPRLDFRLTDPLTGRAELSWEIRPNFEYQMEASASLTDWTPLGLVVTGPPGGGRMTAVANVAESLAFFRVQALPPPEPTCSGVQLIVVSTNRVRVLEGGTASFTIRLSAEPSGSTVEVNVTRAAGDADLRVSGNGTYRFQRNNWNVPQTVTLTAALDADALNGTGTFTVSANGLDSVAVTVEEIDDDAP